MEPTILLATVLLLPLSALAQAGSQFSGAYQWCPFPCETYKINTNNTFEYLIDGDLFNHERTAGKWSVVGKNRIHLESHEVKLIRSVSEKVNTERDKLSIVVQDSAGGLFAGLTIRVIIDGKKHDFATDADGRCELPKTGMIEIIYLRRSEKYNVKNSLATHLAIEIEAYVEPLVDDDFIIKKNAICKLDENGKQSEACYPRISKKIEKKLFPDR